MITLILVLKIIDWSYFLFSNHSQLLIIHLESPIIYNNLKCHRASDQVGIDQALI